MKLREALQVIRNSDLREGKPFKVYLAAGFEPLHLRTFLAAHLAGPVGDRPAEVECGLFGDLAGNIERIASSGAHAAAVVIEWSDLDPRLGLRRLGGWGQDSHTDLVASVRSRLATITSAIIEVGSSLPLAVSMPSLPFVPVFPSRHEYASVTELEIMHLKAEAAVRLARLGGVKLLSETYLSLLREPGKRGDITSELATGFPYSLEHASIVAAALADLIIPPPPRKGLITDLDDTVWRGLIGEDGLAAVSWDIENRSHIHALYQQTLNAIAEAGGLIAVATRNDPELVAEGLARHDLVLAAKSVFPVKAHWGPKSQSVREILDAWNIGAGDVIFVDDNPLELAEVAAAFPEIECRLFEARSPESAYNLLRHLRHAFGKSVVTAEDSLRGASIRAAQSFRSSPDVSSPEDLLASLEAELTVSESFDPDDPRPLELINKTNQFNLNGKRLTTDELKSLAGTPGKIFLEVSYADRFGPLGRISVLLATLDGQIARVSTWVMSCRAFSRRIEYAILDHLFATTGVSVVELDFQATARNTPIREFLSSLSDANGEAPLRIEKSTFERSRPPTYFGRGA